MANTGFKGLLQKQTGVPLTEDFLFVDSSGNDVNTGTATVKIKEKQDDGSFKTLEWATGVTQYTFVTTPTTSVGVLTNQGDGIWNFVLDNVSNFAVTGHYILVARHSTAANPVSEKKIQYGGAEGDLVVTPGTVGIGTLNTNAPTAVAIRTEMDTNSTKLSNLDATISSRNATTPPTVAQITTAIFTDLMSSTDMNTVGSFGALIKSYINAAIGNIPTTPLLASNYVVPPTAVAIRTEMDSNSTKLSNLDATISSRNATTPPTAVAIRTEMDSNSTKLSNLDATVSSRNATTPPTAVAIRTEMDSNSTKLSNLDATVSSRLATNAYTSPNNAQINVIYNKLPTNNIADQNFLTTQIGTPVQTGATVNANLIQVLGTALTQTLAGYLASGISYFFNVSTPTQTMNTTGGGGSGPTVEQIATRLLLTPQNKLATNTDGSVNVSGGVVNVQVLSNFNRDGTRLKLVRGNDYAAANNNLLTFSITNRPELIGTTAHLRFYGQRLDACVSTTITNATQIVTMGDMLSDYTNQFAGGSEVQYQLNFLTPAGLTNTVINGLATIIQKC